MKRLISILTLALAFFSFCIAQEGSEPCPPIKISSPETVQFGGTFKAFASFQNEKQPSTSKFDWIVLKEQESDSKPETSRFPNSGRVEVAPWNENEGGTITLIAGNIDNRCEQIATARVFVMPNVGPPLILDEYGELGWKDEKGRLDAVVNQMQKHKDSELVAFFTFPNDMSGRVRRSRLEAMLKHLTITRNFNLNSITIILEEDSDVLRSRFQPIPKGNSEWFQCAGCVVIKGEDFTKLSNLFKSK